MSASAPTYPIPVSSSTSAVKDGSIQTSTTASLAVHPNSNTFSSSLSGKKRSLSLPSTETTPSNVAVTSTLNQPLGTNTNTRACCPIQPQPIDQIQQQQKQQKQQKQVPLLAPLNREGKNLSEKKLRRLEKNRISARECRRKKREAAQNLEREINILEGENLRLRLQLQIGDEAEKTSQKEQERLTEFLDSLLKSGASESEIYATIEEYKEKCADYGRDRRSAIDFHLKHVERLLMPTTTTSVAMRALQGGGGTVNTTTTTTTNENKTNTPNHDDTQDNNNEKSDSILSMNPKEETRESTEQKKEELKNKCYEPKAMFQFLVNYLEVTPEQAAALKDSRSVSKELDSLLARSVAMLHELKQRLAECGEDLEAEFANVRSILCPTQAAKFLVWVANNRACMHMLNELWNKVYPKPVIEPIEDPKDVDFGKVDNPNEKSD